MKEIGISFGSYLYHMYKTLLIQHQTMLWKEQQWFTFCACVYRKYAKKYFYEHCQNK